MLTPAQQKVKQELEELKANSHYHCHDEERAFPPPKPKSLKKFVLAGIGIGLLFFFFAFALSSPNHKDWNAYLTKEQEYNRESMRLVEAVYSGTSDTVNGSLASANSKHMELLLKVKEMPVPAGLKAHKQDFIRVAEQRGAIFSLLSESGTGDSLQLNKFLLELDIKKELAMESLLKAFEQEKVEYKLKEDGSVQYWINRESYQFSW